MVELRIKRSGLSARLAPMLDVTKDAVESKDSFQKTVRERIMGGAKLQEFEQDRGWEKVPARTRDLIRQLSDTHSQLAARKSRIKQLDQVFNPVTHKSQTQILTTIIAEVGNELSTAFLRIGSEYPVTAIDVAFGASGPLSLDLLVRLKNGSNCFPHQLFSEAYREFDRAALLHIGRQKSISARPSESTDYGRHPTEYRCKYSSLLRRLYPY